MSACALLIGRDGSLGFPGKNTFPILGRPMMAYPLLAVKNAPSVDEIYVSTDSPSIKEVALRYGALVLDRPAALATKQALGEDVFAHGYSQIKARRKKPVDFMVLLFCNAPTLLAATVEEGIAALEKNPGLDSAVTVSRYNMWSPLRARKRKSDGTLQPFVPFETFGDPKTLNCDRDSQGDVLFADMSVSIVRPRCLENLKDGLLPQRWMGQKIWPLEQWGGCDIDYDWQVPGVAHWLEKHGFSETRTPYDK